MSQTSMVGKEIFYTRLQQGSKDWTLVNDLRARMIKEAISWKGGPSMEEARKMVVNRLPGNIEVFFLKPGKEAFNKKRINPHDMTPKVGSSYDGAKFDDIFTYISRISIIDDDIFKKVLVLIYRNAFLLDHKDKGEGLRYLPEGKLRQEIKEISNAVNIVLPPGGIFGLLNFLDILGWNEDVKYHTEMNRPTFKGKYQPRVGRINTLLTCIRVSHQMRDFVKDVLDKVHDPMEIDFKIGFRLMQDFLKTRGTCTPRNQDLLEWFSPFIQKK